MVGLLILKDQRAANRRRKQLDKDKRQMEMENDLPLKDLFKYKRKEESA